MQIANYVTPNIFIKSPKVAKIVGGWGSAPDPAGGAYSAPPDPLAALGWDGDLKTLYPSVKKSWVRAWLKRRKNVAERSKNTSQQAGIKLLGEEVLYVLWLLVFSDN